MTDLKQLKDVPLSEIHAVFIAAFSDYDIPMDLPFWKFRNICKRRGIDLEYSMGIFIDNKFFGFKVTKEFSCYQLSCESIRSALPNYTEVKKLALSGNR